MKQLIILILTLGFLQGCEKSLDYSLEGELPSAPEFKIEQVLDDPNRFVVTDLSSGNFTRLWEFSGGQPEASKLESDTITYNKKGEYEIKLHISAEGGSGTALSSQTVSVLEDAAGCPFPMLNEDCTSKCWRLSGEAEGVRIGPTPFSGEWFTSSGIEPTQADDQWCFSDDGTLEYNNNGGTFSACQGYVDDPDYPLPTVINYEFLSGAGFEGTDQMNIDGIFMGIEDSGPTYDIIEISETKMVVLTPLKPCDGSASTGWFTLTFFSTN